MDHSSKCLSSLSLYLSKPFASTTPVATNSTDLLHVVGRIRPFSLFWTSLWQLCLVLPSSCGGNDHVSHFLTPCSQSLTNLRTFIRCPLDISFPEWRLSASSGIKSVTMNCPYCHPLSLSHFLDTFLRGGDQDYMHYSKCWWTRSLYSGLMRLSSLFACCFFHGNP